MLIRCRQILSTALTFATVTLVLVSNVNSEIEPLVKTPLGDVRGFHMKTRGGRVISAFTSIPYALPPVDELRFKGPVPITQWQQTLTATADAPVCVQRNPYIRQQEIVGQEDCLYLNIYTPYNENYVDDKKKLLPVMLFLHGGGWMCGDSTTAMYGPEFLLDKDVLLVTINYRLGPLGFLSTQDEHCPGNNGLKDQQEALRFVQKVIESFGGDPKSITIFGESAGGASVHYHMLSKNSVGLFHKGISESGTAFVPWAESSPGEALKNAYRLAKFLDCPITSTEELIRCLRTKDAYDIINTEFKFYAWDYEAMTPFKAVVEPDHPEAFLTKSPRQIFDVPAVPWMTGLAKDEGCLKSVWITSNSTRLNEYVSGFETIAPVTFYYENSPYADEITKKIKEKYMKDQDIEAIKTGILQAYTDSYFAYPYIEGVEHILKYTKNSVYLYELTYRATNSFSQVFGDPEGNYGVCHADDLMHLFPIHFLEKPISADDIRFSELIVTMWTNFATSGNPNKPIELPFRWDPATCGPKLNYLDIGLQPVMKTDHASRSRFWGTLPLWHNSRTHRVNEEL